MSAKQTVTVSKIVNGNSKTIANAIAASQIADLLTTNPASQACLEVCQNSEFVKLASTGDGEYSVHVEKTADDGTQSQYTVNMEKKNIAKFVAGVLAIGKAIESVMTLKTIEGEMGSRGRKSLVADFSEL